MVLDASCASKQRAREIQFFKCRFCFYLIARGFFISFWIPKKGSQNSNLFFGTKGLTFYFLVGGDFTGENEGISSSSSSTTTSSDSSSFPSFRRGRCFFAKLAQSLPSLADSPTSRSLRLCR